MRHIYLSAHLDDAVLSLGGLSFDQARQGEIAEIWTVMAGVPRGRRISPLAARVLAEGRFGSASEALRCRRAEDREAAQVVGARAVHFRFLDCIYRRTPRGRWLYDAIFVALDKAERTLADDIARELAHRLRPDDAVYSCIGVGGHVDHRILRRAAELLHREVVYYADLPYALNRRTPWRHLVRGLRAHRCAVSRAGVRAWLRAAGSYRSQLRVLFRSKAAMARTLATYIAAGRGVRLWSRRGG